MSRPYDDWGESTMRADRLLSLLMLLQARGRVTAQKLAEELEVSERTIYRDIEALGMAGVPVYAERGPGGGCSLLDSYRTSLTGLTENEVRALFMLSIPAPLAALGVSDELKTALLKLSAALPSYRRHEEEEVRQRIHLDSVWWFQREEFTPHLQAIRRAVWKNRKLHLIHRLTVPVEIHVEQIVDPYGLVAKAGIWYMVCARNGHLRVYRVSHLVDVRLLDETFERPADFDLAAFWNQWCSEYEDNRPYYPVSARIAPELVPYLRYHFDNRLNYEIVQAAPPDAEGWITLTLPFETLEEARVRILGFGRAIEVLEPEALRLSVIDFAEQIVAFYSGKQGEGLCYTEGN